MSTLMLLSVLYKCILYGDGVRRKLNQMTSALVRNKTFLPLCKMRVFISAKKGHVWQKTKTVQSLESTIPIFNTFR